MTTYPSRALTALWFAMVFSVGSAAHCDVYAQLGTGKLVAKQLITDLCRPVFVTSPPGDAERLFIVERRYNDNTGKIQIHDRRTGAHISTFLSIADVRFGGEEGLLGLAFHPDYATNGKFYVYHSATDSSINTDSPHRISVVSSYTASDKVPGGVDDPNIADTTVTSILKFKQPQGNHNGGWIGFNPAATGAARYHLFVSTGDGGGGNDNAVGHTPLTGNGQDMSGNLLGKILRLDVGPSGTADDFPADPVKNYAIPVSNPFVGFTGLDEIWSYGLRNPWRCSFDRQTGDFYIADVGQNYREEIDFQPAGDFDSTMPVALNYGWRLREGIIATPSGGVGGSPPMGAVEPILDYPSVETTEPSGLPDNSTDNSPGEFSGDSITGGCVYRGRMKWLQGKYFFGEYKYNRFWSIRYDGSTVTDKFQWMHWQSNGNSTIDPLFEVDPPTTDFNNYCSISEGGDGEIYVCTQGQNNASETDGSVFLLTQDPFFLFRSTHFTEAQLNENSVSGPNADFDKDGLTTLEEFLFNTNPVVADAPQTELAMEQSLTTPTAGVVYLTLTLEVSEEAKAIATYGGRSGQDLSALSGGSAVSAFDPPGSTTLKVQDSVPLGTDPARFLQIEASVPPSALTN